MTDTPPTETSKLAGLALDYWVAVADGQRAEKLSHEGRGWVRLVGGGVPYSPSTLWGQAGPIIERERIAIWGAGGGRWCATRPGENGGAYPGDEDYIDVNDLDSCDGPTPLVAAMRAFVLEKLGPVVS